MKNSRALTATLIRDLYNVQIVKMGNTAMEWNLCQDKYVKVYNLLCKVEYSQIFVMTALCFMSLP